MNTSKSCFLNYPCHRPCISHVRSILDFPFSFKIQGKINCNALFFLFSMYFYTLLENNAVDNKNVLTYN